MDDISRQSELPNVYVGGLNFDTTKDTLESHFSQYGKVKSAVIITDQNTGRSKGYGFVNYYKVEHRDNALKQAHRLDDRDLTCSIAKESKKMYGGGFNMGGSMGGGMGGRMGGMGGMGGSNMFGGGGGGGGSFGKPDDDRKVFMGGLHSDTEPEDIVRALSVFGRVEKTDIKRDKETYRSRGFGFATFESPDSAEKAIGVHYIEIHEKQVEIKGVNPNASSQQAQNFGGYNNGNMYNAANAFGSMSQYGYQNYDGGSSGWQSQGNMWQGGGDSTWNSSGYGSTGYGSGTGSGTGSFNNPSGSYGNSYGSGSYGGGSYSNQLGGQGGSYSGQGSYGGYGQSNTGQNEGTGWY